MSEPLNQASQTSVGNSLAGAEYAGDDGYTNAPVWRDFSALSMEPTGEQQNLDFLNEPYSLDWPESKKLRWEEHWVGGVSTTPKEAAKRTLADMEAERKRAAEMQSEQRKAEIQANTPQARAELQGKMAQTAAAQAEIQQQYLQELQYQRHIATLNNTNATKAQRAAAINSIDGLAASIGQRMIKGTSTASVADAKRLVGTVSSRIPVLGVNVQEYNPMADYGPQLESMLNKSQERMGVIRQQMESANIPLPETKQVEAAMNAPAPSSFELSVQRLGVKAADGSQVMLNGAPVIRGKNGMLLKAMPNGRAVELTEQEIAQLGQ